MCPRFRQQLRQQFIVLLTVLPAVAPVPAAAQAQADVPPAMATRVRPVGRGEIDDAVIDRAAIDHAVIERAVRAVLAEKAARDGDAQANRVASAAAGRFGNAAPGKYTVFAAMVEQARLPDCLHAEGLRNQPTGIGPFVLGGYLALPFIAVAKLRGVCR
jgi:hypothetical protein